MDFHSLTRKELQTLCKKNKIPANLTNVAMADALKALQTVDGLEELFKSGKAETEQSSVDSPEKTGIKSPSIPRTGCRTSTRRKSVKEEPQSSQVLTRTRRGTRKPIPGGLENTNIGVPETPAVQSSQKKGLSGLLCRKMETQLKEAAEDEKEESETPATRAMSRRKVGSSVQHGYSTRRTTKLLEKQMMELNLNDEEVEHPHIDAADKEMVENLKINEESVDIDKESEVKGTNQEKIPDEKIDVEALSDGNVREPDDSVPQVTGDNHVVVSSKVEPQAVSDVDDESGIASVPDEQMDTFIDDIKDADDEVYDENKVNDDSLTKQEEDWEKCNESNVPLGENLDKLPSLGDETAENEGFDDVGFNKILPHHEHPTETLMFENDEGFNANIKLNQEEYAVQDSRLTSIGEEKSKGKACNSDREVCSGQPVIASINRYEPKNEESMMAATLISGVNCKGEVLSNDEEVHKDHTEHIIGSNQLGKGRTQAYETCDCEEESDQLGLVGEEKFKGEANKDEPEYEESMMAVTQISEEMPKGEVLSDDEEVSEDQREHLISTSQLENEKKLAFQTCDCGEESGQPMINLVGEFSSKAPSMAGNINILMDNNKENIDNSGKKSEFTKEEKNKDTKDTEEFLNDLSLGQLKKLFKKKLQIINEEENTAKVGKPRPALQTLSDNCLVASKAQNEN